MKSATAIAFDCLPSRWIARAASAIAFAAAAAPWFSGLPLGARTVVSAVVVAIAFVSLRHFLAPRYRRIAWRPAGWLVVDLAGREHPARLKAHVHRGEWLSLDLQLDRKRRCRVVLGPDNLDADTRRRLILLLARAEVAHAL